MFCSCSIVNSVGIVIWLFVCGLVVVIVFYLR